MESKFAFDVLSSYFNYLSSSGKIKKGDQCKMLVLVFFYKMLNSELSAFINGEDYNEIQKTLNELYGSHCLIPYPEFKESKSVNTSKDIIIVNPRIRDTNTGLRVANDLYRLV